MKVVINAVDHRGRNFGPNGYKIIDSLPKISDGLKDTVVAREFIHDFPQSLNGVQIGAIGGQAIEKWGQSLRHPRFLKGGPSLAEELVFDAEEGVEALTFGRL